MLNLKEIKKDYQTASETVHALKGVSIAFRKNEFVSILGPSGCGKTTLLNIVGGLDKYSDGDLVINGRSTKSYTDRDWDVYRNHRIGFIFQSYNLIPHQTVLMNVELALTIAGVSKEERTARAKQALDRVGLSGQYGKRPNQLSGGQCQRVAIARALVNNPEILLADEPTGALDTVTSVQIMELIKEISRERLVIMVTHNPELAEEYSSRIVRLLDGEVIEDSNPFSDEEELAECEATEKADNEELQALLSEAKDEKERKKIKKSRKERAKMSIFTAFMLSAKNLLSKKGRTAMVGFAGSIGIIGIAMVLAFSSGIKGYIASMQDDMLSGNPITITETGYDLEALSGIMDTEDKIEIIKQPNRVYISSLIEYFAKMDKAVNTIMVENELTKEYINFVKAMPKEYYNAMLLKYGIDLSNNVYTEFKTSGDAEPQSISISALTSLYTAILKETEFKDYASYVTALAPSLVQLPNNKDYILSQYNLVGGENSKFAENANEIMLVLDSNDELSDLLLARFGYYTQEEFLEIIDKETASEDNPESNKFDPEKYRDSFAYEELIGKTMYWYSNDTVFNKVQNPMTNTDMFTYNPYSEGFENGTELKVVGILTPKDTISYGCISSGIYYTEALTNLILEQNANSEIFDYITNISETNTDSATAMYSYYFMYTFDYLYDTDGDGAAESHKGSGAVGPAVNMEDMMNSMTGNQSSAFDHKKMKERLIRTLGGNDVANGVYIYPVSFDEKNLVTDYLKRWNADGAITYDDVTIERENRTDVTFTDTLELIINLINTMIDVVSYALIAFTSISLVVSTVMIGIITYVSVVERIKEIGVIRALGGRKKDVSRLFNAETFIIGLLAGLLGVTVTYLISFVVNLILKPLIGYASIAALPISNAIILILISVLLTLISGLIPSRSAAKKDPVVALRTE